MRRYLSLFVLSLFATASLFAQQTATTPSQQTANCTQVLRLARAVYEQGRLHELEALLKSCLDGEVGTDKGFATVQEKVDAYRLLCLSYIYLEEPGKADEAMLGLLDTDHFFELNPTDPAEFQALYQTFRTEPVFSYGLKLGANSTFAHIITNYPGGSASLGQGKYIPGISFCFAGFAEKEFFPKLADKNPLKWTTLRAEIFYQPHAFQIDVPTVFSFGSDPGVGNVSAATSGKLQSQWLDLNVILRYRYFKRKTLWDPYFGIGPGMSLQMNAKLNQAKFQGNNLLVEDATANTSASTSYSGPAVDLSSAFNKLAQSVSAVWGVNTRFGSIYFNFEARYQYGLGNLINEKNRYIPALNDEYAINLNDYRQSSIILCLGATVPQFSPKKLSKRK